MDMTAAEKILARASGLSQTSAGEFVWAAVDMAVADDVQFAHFLKVWQELGGKIHDPQKVALIADHYGPPSDVDQAEVVYQLRRFGRDLGLPYCYVNEGIKHQVLIEKGLVLPGMVITATDSHTNTMGAVGAFAVALGPTEVAAIWREGRIWFRVPDTIRVEISGQMPSGVYAKDVALHLLGQFGTSFAQYQALEFGGPALRAMTMSERQTLANMSTEMGAKCAIVECDHLTEAFAAATGRPFWCPRSDSGARFVREIRIDVGLLEPLVALPSSPANTRPVSVVAGTAITQAFIGTCTNGNLDDLAVAAEMLRGRRVAPGVQLIITPATVATYRQALAAGLLEVFIDAGAIITNPNCGACAGTHQGTLSKNDVRISTQNRNFRGRGGHVESQIYLASPATVAASALLGVITDPRSLSS